MTCFDNRFISPLTYFPEECSPSRKCRCLFVRWTFLTVLFTGGSLMELFFLMFCNLPWGYFTISCTLCRAFPMPHAVYHPPPLNFFISALFEIFKYVFKGSRFITIGQDSCFGQSPLRPAASALSRCCLRFCVILFPQCSCLLLSYFLKIS